MPIKAGYILTKKNYAYRAADLALGLKLDRQQLLNSTLSTKVAMPEVNKIINYEVKAPIPTEAEQVRSGTAASDFKSLATAEYPKNAASEFIINREVNKASIVNTDLVKELKSKLVLPKLGLKPIQTTTTTTTEQTNIEQQAEPPAQSMVSTALSTVLSEANTINDALSKIKEVDNTTLTEADRVALDKFIKAASVVDQMINSKDKDEFVKIAMGNKNLGIVIPKMNGQTVAISAATKERSIEDSFEKFMLNKEAWETSVYSNIKGQYIQSASGLVVSNYSKKKTPNFGNLILNQNHLKKNILTLRKPYTTKVILKFEGMTPLLKRMIFDIANTLEFDVKDYYNLDSDEKRVIEKIIRFQKEMKDYNISKLIDEDEKKIRKRIDILIGEINAGNESTEIIKEIQSLLKKLRESGALSDSKFRIAMKSLGDRFIRR